MCHITPILVPSTRHLWGMPFNNVLPSEVSLNCRSKEVWFASLNSATDHFRHGEDATLDPTIDLPE